MQCLHQLIVLMFLAFGSLDELKSSIRSMNGNFTHTLKSLETFDPEKSIEATKLASHAKMTETTDNEVVVLDDR